MSSGRTELRELARAALLRRLPRFAEYPDDWDHLVDLLLEVVAEDPATSEASLAVTGYVMELAITRGFE